MAESTEPDSRPTCVGIGLIRRGESYLIRQRPEHTVYAGYWEFPGGKCEPGETPAETTARNASRRRAWSSWWDGSGESSSTVTPMGTFGFTSSIANPPTPLPSQPQTRGAAGSRPHSCRACAFPKPTSRFWRSYVDGGSNRSGLTKLVQGRIALKPADPSYPENANLRRMALGYSLSRT